MARMQPHNYVVALTMSLGLIVPASLLSPSSRHRLVTIVTAVAGGVYLNGGLGAWEFVLPLAMGYCANKAIVTAEKSTPSDGVRTGSNLNNPFAPLALGWVLHTAWDVVHHLQGRPLVSWIPTSSGECAITDLVWAAWLFAGAPSIFGRKE